MAIDLKKSTANFKISLEKKGVAKMPELEMAIIMDVSGSFDDEHRDGVTNDLTTRLVPYGLTFDPDQKVDFFTFAGRKGSAHYVGAVHEQNYTDFIRKQVIGKVPGYGTGTDYAPVTTLSLQHFGWVPGGTPQTGKKSGFLGSLFGKKQEAAENVEKRRAIIFFVTDGDNNDPDEMDRVMHDAYRNKHEVFFVFVGVSNQNVSFASLKGYEQNFGNAMFREIKRVDQFVKLSDDEINDFFLQPKLVSWLKK